VATSPAACATRRRRLIGAVRPRGSAGAAARRARARHLALATSRRPASSCTGRPTPNVDLHIRTRAAAMPSSSNLGSPRAASLRRRHHRLRPRVLRDRRDPEGGPYQPRSTTAARARWATAWGWSRSRRSILHGASGLTIVRRRHDRSRDAYARHARKCAARPRVRQRADSRRVRERLATEGRDNISQSAARWHLDC
jgi:hypothetical protein